MTAEIAKAVKTRWTAKSLGSTVTGGIWHSRVPERTSMPYCVYTEVYSAPTGETHCQRIGRMEIQFDLYDDSGDPETVADMAVAVRDAFVYSHAAPSNPLDPQDVAIVSAQLGQDITTRAEGEEQVYRSTFSLVLTYQLDVDRTPA